MDVTLDRRGTSDQRPLRGACLVAGCPCKDPRIISTRRVAFFAEWARRHGETADRIVEPDPDWRELTVPWQERSSWPAERPDRDALRTLRDGPSRSYHPSG